MRSRVACDKEPIHLAGGIQPIGVLLILDAATLTIIQTSTNTDALLATPPQSLLGTHVSTLVPPEIVATVVAWLEQSNARFLPPIRFLLRHGPTPTPVDMVMHRIDRTLQVEILPVPPSDEKPDFAVEAIHRFRFSETGYARPDQTIARRHHPHPGHRAETQGFLANSS